MFHRKEKMESAHTASCAVTMNRSLYLSEITRRKLWYLRWPYGKQERPLATDRSSVSSVSPSSGLASQILCPGEAATLL